MQGLDWQGIVAVGAVGIAVLFAISAKLSERRWEQMYTTERKINRALRTQSTERCIACRDNTARKRASICNVDSTGWRP